MRKVRWQHGWWLLVVAVAAWLMYMTLRPNQTVAADLAPLTESVTAQIVPAQVLIGIVGNVVVFVPLGIALALALRMQPANRCVLLATLGGAGLSLGIELLQSTLSSRISAVDDWLLNTAGTAIGATAGCGFLNIWRRKTR